MGIFKTDFFLRIFKSKQTCYMNFRSKLTHYCNIYVSKGCSKKCDTFLYFLNCVEFFRTVHICVTLIIIIYKIFLRCYLLFVDLLSNVSSIKRIFSYLVTTSLYGGGRVGAEIWVALVQMTVGVKLIFNRFDFEKKKKYGLKLKILYFFRLKKAWVKILYI